MDWKTYFAELGVDSHLHMYNWNDPKTWEHFLHGLEESKEVMSLRSYNIAAFPSGACREIERLAAKML